MTIRDVPPLPLTDLRPGDTARLHSADLDSETASLLRAIGLTDSAGVRLCQAGNPCIVQVRTTRIGLSDTVAQRIFVLREPIESKRP